VILGYFKIRRSDALALGLIHAAVRKQSGSRCFIAIARSRRTLDMARQISADMFDWIIETCSYFGAKVIRLGSEYVPRKVFCSHV
jgi:hypothetical protein